ncbi:hypothetical protein FH972_004652 [Carpinus fangiana]|uniref:Small EDRK-rich factor-like N-terminal domain-containing protein n=1 Tax=Carpinus fangiana TaxID=176857 RepID=A0A5N6QQ49_9ROSI|nr:hypothetical protein FH972_004652 [Carpinus fangiana]
MGGGNGQKAKMAREKNLEKQKAAKGSQLDSNKKAMTIQEESLCLGSSMGEVSSCQKARGIGELPPGSIRPFSLYALMIVANGLHCAESLMNSALDPFPQASCYYITGKLWYA